MKRLALVLSILVAGILSAPFINAQSDGPPFNKLGNADLNINFCTMGAVDLLLDVFYPDVASGPVPVVMYVHGGGWRNGDKGAISRWGILPELRSRGYLVVSVNYRLAPQFQFPAMIEDVKCAVRHLRAEAETYGLDPSRIGAWGTSAGGHLVSLLGVTDGSEGWDETGQYLEQSSRVQVVVDMYGPIDLPAIYDRNHEAILAAVYGASSAEDEILRIASPNTWISPDDPPVLMIHGDQDPVVPLEQSEIFLSALSSAGIPSKLVVVENGGHGFNNMTGPINPGFEEITDIVSEFFDEWLRD
jgi:acetyl esterase/lipase